MRPPSFFPASMAQPTLDATGWESPLRRLPVRLIAGHQALPSRLQAAGFAVLAVGTVIYARGDEAQEKEEDAKMGDDEEAAAARKRVRRRPVIKGGRTIGFTGTHQTVVIAKRFIRR